jgi:hypothetical protein
LQQQSTKLLAGRGGNYLCIMRAALPPVYTGFWVDKHSHRHTHTHISSHVNTPTILRTQ